MKANILNRLVVAASIGAMLLVGISISTNAHEEPQHEQKDQKQQNKKQKEQQHAQQQQQQNQNKQQHAQWQQPEHTQHGQLQLTQQQRHAQQGEQRGAWQQHRAHSWESEHRTWQQRGGYHGYRIPDKYFRSYCGRGHWFRVYSLPFMVVGGYPRFQYNGYWFSFVDPYPEYWGNTWYETDDVYVDYVDDGYYLYNRRYTHRPGISINISF